MIRNTKHIGKLLSGLLALKVGSRFVVGQAAAASSKTSACTGRPGAFQDLYQLLGELHSIGIVLGLGLASIGYTIAGIYYIMGGPQNTQKARSWMINTTVGVTIILLSSSFVDFMRDVLCG